MNYKIIKAKGCKVIELEVALTKSLSENHKTIVNHWKRFNHEFRIRQVELAGNWLKYGVTKQIDDQYFYSTAILKLIEVAGFSEEELKIGEYMCFDHRGHMGLLKSTLNNIYKKVIPESDFNIDESRTTIHYEQYDRRFYGTSLAH